MNTYLEPQKPQAESTPQQQSQQPIQQFAQAQYTAAESASISNAQTSANGAGGSPQIRQLRKMTQVASASPQVQKLTQLQSIASAASEKQMPQMPKENRTGLPDKLKSGIENLGGYSMDDVRVHYNSSKPAQLQAHAYAQGTEIHIAPGQERHLPHEAWHVVQQKQGRVKPTLQMKGIAINDDSALEKEADVMGDRAMGGGSPRRDLSLLNEFSRAKFGISEPVQRVGDPPFERELSLQTSYLKLGLKNSNAGKISEDQVDDYEVTYFEATSRPPAYLAGKKLGVQGQHKVAWVAIWSVLSRCEGKKVNEAKEILDSVVKDGAPDYINGKVAITVTMNRKTPEIADTLISKAHNYLVARQIDDPSWEAVGDEDEKREQLKGKGEVALKRALKKFQEFSDDENEMDLKEFMKNELVKLFDVTGREEDEIEDVLERAKLELSLHNPGLYKKKKKVIDGWVDSMGPKSSKTGRSRSRSRSRRK